MIPEFLASAPRVYRGKRFDLAEVAVVTAQGQKKVKEVVLAPDSVVIVPLLDEQTVVLIRNQRAAAGTILWELPAGTMEAGENPDLCAARELVEETGYQAKRLEKLMAFYPAPGASTEFMTAYRATGLTQVGQSLDVGEEITVHPTPIRKALEMIVDGTIRDGKTIATLLHHQYFAGK